MKKLLFVSCFIVGLTNLNAQLGTCDFTEDYSDPSPWTPVNTNAMAPTSPDIIITGGAVEFNNVRDGWNDVRIHRRLGRTLCNSWVAEFVFDPSIQEDGDDEVGQNIFCLTAGNANPTRDVNLNWTDQDGINVYYYDLGDDNDCRFRVEMKDGTTLTGTPAIMAPFDRVWGVRLERIDGVKGRLTITDIIADTAKSICFDIPSSIIGLNSLQHANYTRASLNRRLQGTLDNVCIYDCQRVAECCILMDIAGPTEICYDGEASTGTYSVTNDASASYKWIVNGGTITSGQNTSQITVSFPSTSGTTAASIQVIVECNCFSDTLSKTVQISNILSEDGNFTRLMPDDGSIYTSITLSSISSTSGFIHEWFLYEGADCNDPDHPISNTTPLASGTGSTWNQSLSSLSLSISDCYVLEHIMTPVDGICPPIIYRRHQSPTDTEGELFKRQTKTNSRLNSSELEVYPNPSGEVLNVELLNANKSILSISIFDMLGTRLIFEDKQLDTKNIIDLKELAPGTYVVSVKYTDQTSKSVRFTKK